MTTACMSIRERFEKYVEPEPMSGCHLWAGSFAGKGYGVLALGRRVGGRTPHGYAHRIAYELYVGPIPPGLFVLHKCDVARCVNPSHLFLGTPADNNADMAKKERGRKPTSGLPCGVYLNRSSKKIPSFVAKVGPRHSRKYLGAFATAEEAGAAAAAFKKSLYPTVEGSGAAGVPQ